MDLDVWLGENAHALSTSAPDGPLDELEPLRGIVGDARVVALGEPVHFIHEYYEVKHRIVRFLVERMGFSVFAFESGWAEGLAVEEWLATADDAEPPLLDGFHCRIGACEEMRDQLQWMRDHGVRYSGIDMSFWFDAMPLAIERVLSYLDSVDPAAAQRHRDAIVPLLAALTGVLPGREPAGRELKPVPLEHFGPLPIDGYLHVPVAEHRIALAALFERYGATDQRDRDSLTASLAMLEARLEDREVVYRSLTGDDAFETGLRLATSARQTDAFLAAQSTRGWGARNVRDAVMADSVERLVRRGERVIVSAHNGHVQKCFAGPTYPPATTVTGQYLAGSLGDDYVAIGMTFTRGHIYGTVADAGEDGTIDALLAHGPSPAHLLDLGRIPASGPVAGAFDAATKARENHLALELDWRRAFDALLHVHEITPAQFLG